MPGPVSLKHRIIGRGLDMIYGSPPESSADYGRPVAFDDAGCVAIGEALSAEVPVLIGRFGSTELAVVSYRERWRMGPVRLPYLPVLRRTAHVASGIHPTDDDSLDRFCDVLLGAAGQADVMGVWFNRSEPRIVRRYCPQADLVYLDSLNAIVYENPWTEKLAGRRVLVVHPFAATIERQYHCRRTLLFDDPRVLPEFELSTYVPVQSIAGNLGAFETWFDALEHMKEEIDALTFDVAIIGAGAYGLPLGAHVKSMGRQAVHLGGVTQLLFGIRGRRWEVESPDIACLFNEHWVRASAEETPAGHDKVEGGCYW